jgi:nucleoid-associated protein YgaU
METRLKIALATGIVLGGLLLAMLFRQGPPRADAIGPSADDQLVLRKHADAAPAASPQPETAGRATMLSSAPVAPGMSRPPAMKPAEAGGFTPDPARPLVPGGSPANSRWGITMNQVLPDPGRLRPSPLKHKIIDGDTLPALAERYLGSPDRATEIFEANRDVLANPQILPIGAVLRLPPRDGAVAASR